jgi:uncharacterized protein YjbI with pentapeptide repeats
MPDVLLDEMMPKTRGEVIVAGNAFVIGEPLPGTNVRVTIERPQPPEGATDAGEAPAAPVVDKELVVFGDRTWSLFGMSEPAPFREMPLTWDRAFGGEGFADNPKGRGLRSVEVDGKKVHPLPNVELPNKLLKSPSDKPAPAGFLPLDMTSPSRMKRVGTYDQAWLETRFPYYPEDFDWEFFNVAPSDQRIDGFFRGDETFRLEGMHAERRTVEGALPPVVARSFIERKSAPGELVEVPMHVDTLFFFPNALLGVIAFRGTVKVDEDDADDVKTLLGAIDTTEAPRPLEHYLEVKRLREDKDGAHLQLLDDRPLLPAWFTAPEEIEEGWDDMSPHLQYEFFGRKRAQAEADRLLADARKHLREAGLSEKEAETELPTVDLSAKDKLPKDLGELPRILEETRNEMEATRASLEKQQAEREAETRKLLAESGRDYDAERAAALKAEAGPPKRSLAKEYARLREEVAAAERRGVDVSAQKAELASMSDDELRELEERQLEAYRRFGHEMPVAPDTLDPETSRARLDEALARRAKGESLRRFDFTGVDLRGADLSGANLSQAMFECASFEGANLTGANLTEAMLGRARLDGGDFSKASLKGANLSRSTFAGARLDGADLTRADFYESRLDGASFRGAKLHTITFLKTHFGAVDLEGAELEMVMLVEADASRSRFVGMKTDQVSFIQCRLDHADFTGAKLTRTSFVESSAEGAVFVDAQIDRLAFVGECKAPNAVFRGASMKHACFRGASLVEADFSSAVAEECDFSAAVLERAKLHRLNAQRSLFIRTDFSRADVKGAVLMYSVLQKARLYGADFRGANLFRADLSKVRGDDATTFEDAYLAQITVAGTLGEQRARLVPREAGA